MIQVSSIISAQTVSSVGRVAEESDSDTIAPDVFYTPGANPDIVALTLNDAGNRFKESLTPEPEVTRSDELVDTRFDVITYSTGNANSLFLRREEFAAVSCECNLKAPPNLATAGGRRPTVWLGDEYRDPDFIAKAYGISENGQQSRLCNTCCRDHHDDVDHGGENVFNPYRPSADYQNGGAFRGDHKHYKKDQQGNLSVALADDTYVEACRLVRKDGFFVVAQDFDLGSLNVFPYDFLVGPVDVAAYSGWLTGEVDTFTDTLHLSGYDESSADYDFIPPELADPVRSTDPGVPIAGELVPQWTSLPTALNKNFQQLRSRGVYVDYMTADLIAVVNCLKLGGDAETCQSGDVILDKGGSEDALEIIPFFEVQLTFLNSWSEDMAETVVEVTSEPVETGNTHSRGEVSKVPAAVSFAEVTATGHQGVLGFTDTDPIDMNYDAALIDNTIDVYLTNDGPVDPGGIVITGTITSGVNGVNARNVVLVPSGAACDFVGVTFTCLVTDAIAELRVSNYHKQNDNDIEACTSHADTFPRTTQNFDANGFPFSVFNISGALPGTDYQISIQAVNCGGGFGG